MTLPNLDRAVIETEKLRDYLLSDAHPVGRFKAVFFKALGFHRDEWERLRDALLAVAAAHPAQPTSMTAYGRKYEVRGTLRGRNLRSAEVVTVWIMRSSEDFPRLVTVYPE